MYKHKIGVVYHQCDIRGCQFKAIQKGDLTRHKADIHNIGKVTIHICGVNGCQYETKKTTNLKQHKMRKHKIGVVYHQCDIPGCQYKAIQKGKDS